VTAATYPLEDAPLVLGLDCHLAVVVVPAMLLYAKVQAFEEFLASLCFSVDIKLSYIGSVRKAKPVAYLLSKVHVA